MNELDHVGLYVKDLAKSVVFYGEIFGFEVVRTMDLGEAKIAFLDIGGGLLELIQPLRAPGLHPKAGGTTPPTASTTTMPWSPSSRA
ncbi:VOC family protein [Candidatus Bathyarchaeota archaeon]|nr:VOC family protein [Candidatus Bathyarchaeota archaeon]